MYRQKALGNCSKEEKKVLERSTNKSPSSQFRTVVNKEKITTTNAITRNELEPEEEGENIQTSFRPPLY